jgi:hypothetical protein
VAKLLPGKFKLSQRESAKFIGYWPFSDHEKKSKAFANLRISYDLAIYGAEKFHDHMAKLKAEGNLSEKGLRDAAVKFLADEGLPKNLRNKLEATATLRRDVNARLARMSPVQIDPNNLTAEMQRREVRDALRTMPEQDRIRLIERGDDPTIIDAVLSAPQFLSGVPDSVMKMAKERRLDERYGDERKVMADLIEAAETVERAFDAAREEYRAEAEITEYDFEKMTKPIEESVADEFRKTLQRLPINEAPIDGVAELAHATKGVPDIDNEDAGPRLFGDRAA